MFKWLRRWLSKGFVPLPDHHFIASAFLMAGFKRNDSKKLLQRYQSETPTGFVLSAIFQASIPKGFNQLFITVRVYRLADKDYLQSRYFLRWSFGNRDIADGFANVIHGTSVFCYSAVELDDHMKIVYSSILTMAALSHLMKSSSAAATPLCQEKLKKIYETFPPP